MSTMTFKVVLGNNQTTTVSINIIGTNLYIDYGDGTTTTQEPSTNTIKEQHSYPMGSGERTYNATITGNIIGLGDICLGNSVIYDISLPEGLQTIGNMCLSLIKPKKIIIPTTVTTIGSNFLYQSAVEEVVFLGKNLDTIEHNFLYNNTTVKSVILPEGLITLKYGCFYNSTSLETLEIPSTLTEFPIPLKYSSFVNVELKTLKMGGGPISNPPINENTKIIVPLSKLQEFINHSSYPNERERYDVFGKNLSEKVYVLGVHLAENLQDRNITANANEGLTTLANKIHDIDAPNYKELTYNLAWNDNNNEYGLRPSQLPILLLANNEVVGGCLLPQDDDINTLYHANNIQSEYSYTTQVPESDLNGEEITYTWKPLMSPSAYTKQDTSSQNTHTTTMQIKNRRRLMIEPRYESGGSAIDVIIDIYGTVTNNDDNSERTIQFSDFKLDNSGYIIDFFTTSRVQYSLTLKAPDGYNLNPPKITGASEISNDEYKEQNKKTRVVMESEPLAPPAPIDDEAINDS